MTDSARSRNVGLRLRIHLELALTCGLFVLKNLHRLHDRTKKTTRESLGNIDEKIIYATGLSIDEVINLSKM